MKSLFVGSVVFILSLVLVFVPADADKKTKKEDKDAVSQQYKELESSKLDKMDIPPFEKGNEKSVFQLEKAILMNFMLGNEVSGELTYDLRTDFLPTDSASTYVSLGFRVPGGMIAIEDKSPGGEAVQDLRIFGVITQASDIKKPIRQLSFPVTRKLDKKPAAPEPIELYTNLLLEGGDYKAFLGVLDAQTGKYGCTAYTLSVPSYAGEDLKLSSLLFAKKISQPSAPPEGQIHNAISYANLVFDVGFSNELTKNDNPECFFIVKGYKTNPTSGAPEMTADYAIKKNDEVVFQYKSDMNFYMWGQPIPLNKINKITSGDYTLVVTVTDKITNKAATEKCFFKVR
jgi:hypothetical protein